MVQSSQLPTRSGPHPRLLFESFLPAVLASLIVRLPLDGLVSCQAELYEEVASPNSTLAWCSVAGRILGSNRHIQDVRKAHERSVTSMCPRVQPP